MKFYTKKQDIVDWLTSYQVTYYQLIPDETYGFVVNTYSHVDLSEKNLVDICVKFNHVKGNFNCSFNKLTSLKGSPVTVDESFNCSHNELVSLEGCPERISANFNCRYNSLKDLLYIPKEIGLFVGLSENPDLLDSQEIIKFNDLYEENQKQIKTKNKDYLKEKLNLYNNIKRKMVKI